MKNYESHKVNFAKLNPLLDFFLSDKYYLVFNKNYVVECAEKYLNNILKVFFTISDVEFDKDAIFDFESKKSTTPQNYFLYIHCLEHANYLLQAYVHAGKKEYFEYAEKVICEWIEFSGTANPTIQKFMKRDHPTASRGMVLGLYSLICKRDGKVVKEVVSQVLKQHLEHMMSEEYYTRNHNHGVMQLHTIALLSFFYGDQKAYDFFRNELIKQLDFAYDCEGVHRENTIFYQTFVDRFINFFKVIFEATNDPYKEKITKVYEGSTKFLNSIAYPNRAYPAIGDMRYNGKAVAGTPTPGHSVYEKSGYYTARSSVESDATYKMFKAGYSTLIHKHADDLSFLLYAYGQEIFIDPGEYNREYITPMSYYFRSVFAHNTVTVDDQEYFKVNQKSNLFGSIGNELLADKIGFAEVEVVDTFKRVRAFNNMYEGVDITRDFSDYDDMILIHDVCRSNKNHVYRQRFHLNPKLEKISESSGETVYALENTDKVVKIRQFVQCDMQSFRGKKADSINEIAGWCAFEFNELTPTDTLIYTQEGSTVEFITAISIETPDGKFRCGNEMGSFTENLDSFLHENSGEESKQIEVAKEKKVDKEKNLKSNIKPLKRFVFSNLGLNNFDPAWWKYRLAVFETFCLPSMESNIHPNLYWTINVSKATPVKFKRRLYEIIESSPLRGNIYVNEFELHRKPGINYIPDIDFIKCRVSDDERFIIMVFDTDDMLASGFFDRIEKELRNPKDEWGHNTSAVEFIERKGEKFVPDGMLGLSKLPNGLIDQNVTFSFRKCYRVGLDSKTVDVTESIYHSFQTCGLTTIKDVARVNFRHIYAGESAFANNYIQYFCKTDEPMNAYMVYKNSVAAIRWNRDIKLSNSKIEKDILCVPKEKVNEFLKRFPHSLTTFERIVHGHTFKKKYDEEYKKLRKLEEKFYECVNMYSDKSKIYKALHNENEENDEGWLFSLKKVFDLEVAQSERLKKSNDYKKLFKHLKEKLPDVAILMATKGGVGKYFEKCLMYLDELGIHEKISSEGFAEKSKCNFGVILCPLTDVNFEGKTATYFSSEDVRYKNVFSCTRMRDRIDLEFVSTQENAFCQIDNCPVSLNLPGLNIAVWDMKERKLIDVCNINTHVEGLPITRALD